MCPYVGFGVLFVKTISTIQLLVRRVNILLIILPYQLLIEHKQAKFLLVLLF